MSKKKRDWPWLGAQAMAVALLAILMYLSMQRDCSDFRICRAQGYSWWHCHESIFNRGK